MSKTDVRGVADPFMLATTSVARASAGGLDSLEELEEPENQRLEGCRNNVAALFLSKYQKNTHRKAPKTEKKNKIAFCSGPNDRFGIIRIKQRLKILHDNKQRVYYSMILSTNNL